MARYDEALRNFIKGTRNVQAQAGMIPDVWGSNNLVIRNDTQDPKLILLDSEAHMWGRGNDQELLSSLSTLERIL